LDGQGSEIAGMIGCATISGALLNLVVAAAR
jgi:hypothetical protein